MLEAQDKSPDGTAAPVKCLICQFSSTDPSVYFAHLEAEHHFRLGNPNNVVAPFSLVESIRKTMENSVCIYCEKKFPSTAVLRKHMKTKRHCRVNPWNVDYDMYYKSSYSSKGWCTSSRHAVHELSTAAAEKKIEELAAKIKSQAKVLDAEDASLENVLSREVDECVDDWVEEQHDETTACLFCNKTFSSVLDTMIHCVAVHHFDIAKFRRERGLDFYGCVRLINYLRSKFVDHTCPKCAQRIPAERQNEHSEKCSATLVLPKEWEDDKYLIPVLASDPLLYSLGELTEESAKEEDDDFAEKVIPEAAPAPTYQRLEQIEEFLLEQG